MNCDPIARWYRWLEYIGFGRALERRRIAFLSDIADARRVLLLGDGDGRFLEKLIPLIFARPGAAIDYVDISPRMLDLARRRAGTRVNCHLADALSMPLPAAEFDLIVTHFFLDCFDDHDAARLVERVASSAAPHARWLISEFRESGWLARRLIAALYLFFRYTTGLKTTRLIDHHPLLTRAGFALEKFESARAGMLVSELWRRVT
ncbi:MAG TPA: class I SAM-dependent methyltransferase [Bryobacteraceae bacterium]|nr:class I SAM-dependent methyltransferase [Bryobacteraceae bacterium]